MKRKLHRATALAAALALVTAAVSAADEKPPALREIAVSTPRPLAAALDLLERRHGMAVAYEDPAYVNAGDIADVSQTVRKDLEKFPLGKAPRVLVPATGRIELRYPVTAGGEPLDPAAVVQMLIDEHARSGNPGRFRLLTEDGLLVVAPTEVKNAEGRFVATGSVLDTRISLPQKARRGAELLADLAASLSAATGQHVALGMAPINLVAGRHSTFGARDRTAREVLVQGLASLGFPAGRVVWRLFYDPGLKWHVLNLEVPFTAAEERP